MSFICSPVEEILAGNHLLAGTYCEAHEVDVEKIVRADLGMTSTAARAEVPVVAR